MKATILALLVPCFLFTCLSVACFSGAPAWALPSRVKVSLFSSHVKIEKLYVRAPLVVQGPRPISLTSGRFVVDAAGPEVVLRHIGAAKSAVARGTSLELTGPGVAPLAVAVAEREAPHYYKGRLVISSKNDGGLLVINDVDCKSYVTSCVGSECPPGFAPEALKAQTVLSATLLEGSVRAKKYLVDSTEDQSYLGAAAERPEVRLAASAVFGQELFYGAKPVHVYFCSTCGGKTCTPQIFGGGPNSGAVSYPYLRDIKCDFCKASPFYRNLLNSVTAAQLLDKTGISSLVVEQSLDGRPLKIAVGKKGQIETWSGYKLFLEMGTGFDWGFLPSTRFSVSRDGESFSFTSRGCGHGVGLCQWGADGQARAGRGYDQILQFYFPGTKLKTLR